MGWWEERTEKDLCSCEKKKEVEGTTHDVNQGNNKEVEARVQQRIKVKGSTRD